VDAMRGRVKQLSLVAGVWLGAVAAGAGQTNAAAAAVVVTNCAPIQAVVERLAALEQQTRAGQQLVQADCLRARLLKLQGLLAVGQQAQEQLQTLDATKDAALWEQEALKIQFATLRAEKLWAEAQQCLELAPAAAPVAAAAPTLAVTKPATKVRLRSRAVPAVPRAPVARNRDTCVTQARLACLVARAMDLGLGLQGTAAGCAAALTQRAIEPLDGWQPEQCATVDDLYVVVARVLSLRVAEPADPRSYGWALRDAGLPVDTVLPAGAPDAAPPLLVEEEVRQFLEYGYTAPLASSQRLGPE